MARTFQVYASRDPEFVRSGRVQISRSRGYQPVSQCTEYSSDAKIGTILRTARLMQLPQPHPLQAQPCSSQHISITARVGACLESWTAAHPVVRRVRVSLIKIT